MAREELTRLLSCLEVGILIYRLFAAQSPRPPMPLSTLQETSRDVPCNTLGQDGFATSFPLWLLHPLHVAGLSLPSPPSPSIGTFSHQITASALPRSPTL